MNPTYFPGMKLSNYLSAFSQPAEWQRHKATWTAWPAAADLWEENLKPAQEEFSAMVLAVAEGETVNLLVADEAALADAESCLAHPNINFKILPYGDIWLRDTGPIFLKDKEGNHALACYDFNGWGGKYMLPFDDGVSKALAARCDDPSVSVPMVFEGGSIDVNGAGWGLTTRECLLNPNRNPDLSESEIANYIKTSLGISELIWIDKGLMNDHTDGHIDNIARFVDERKVVCMKASGDDDPNAVVYQEIYETLCGAGEMMGFEVFQIPSPGRVSDEEDEIIPASHMNFYIANDVVVVPVYGTPYDAAAVSALAEFFPARKTIGLPAKAIITGGGSFHCITQQEPL